MGTTVTCKIFDIDEVLVRILMGKWGQAGELGSGEVSRGVSRHIESDESVGKCGAGLV